MAVDDDLLHLAEKAALDETREALPGHPPQQPLQTTARVYPDSSGLIALRSAVAMS